MSQPRATTSGRRPTGVFLRLLTTGLLAMALVHLQGPTIGHAGADDARAQLDPLLGSYRFAGGERERQAVEDAIEDVAEDMNFIIRPIARSRLKKANTVAARIRLTAADGKLTVGIDDRTYTAPLGGGSVTVVGTTGDPLRMRYRIRPGRVVQEFRGEKGGRTNRFVRRSDGSMRMSVKVTSDKLPKALAYKLTYARQD